jgi:AcrR family transcriptional regulator
MSSERAVDRLPQAAASVRRRRKQQRPAEIIEAAVEEFARRGFAATRLEDVAERAGVTKGTVYFYFKDKEELFKAAARSSLIPVVGEIEGLDASFEGSAEALLRAHYRVVYAKLVKSLRARQILRLLIAEGPQFPELVEFYYSEIISRGFATLKRVIERGVACGEFRRTRVADFPQVVFGPVLAAMIWTFLLAEKHPIDLERYAQVHVDLILNGLKAPKGKGA